MKYLVFSFLRPGIEGMRGVKFRQLTRNVSKSLMENGKRIVLTLGSLCIPCNMRDTAQS